MKLTLLDIEGPVFIDLPLHPDSRGLFIERFHARRFSEAGLPSNFVQDNHSRSEPRVLRGLHFQYDPPQGKLVGVLRGMIWDVVVDIRPESPTFGRSVGFELSDSRAQVLWIPPGFAHGFCVLGEERADVLYKVDAYYNAKGERGIHWADPELAISWPITDPILSAKDQSLPSFAHYREHPVAW